MKNRIYLIVLLLSALSFFVFRFLNQGDHMSRNYVVGLPGGWHKWHPALQHTVYGDSVFRNVFESLVTTKRGEIIHRSGAKSWSESEDWRVFRFQIDGEKRFSDGSYLTAQDYKDCWEKGLRLEPWSSKNSLSDALMGVEGWADFEKTGKLSGIKVLPGNVLELHFKKSFRTAYQFFTGSRLSVWKEVDGKIIGTGPFFVSEENEDQVHLKPNPYSSEWAGRNKMEFTLKVIPSIQAKGEIERGAVVMYLFADSVSELVQENIDVPYLIATGLEASHWVAHLNSITNRFFDDKKYRQAMQALAWQGLKTYELPERFRTVGLLDPQSYFQIQLGRLADDEVEDLMRVPTEEIEELKKATKKHPLYVVTMLGEEWVLDYLRSLGLSLDHRSGSMETKKRINMYYKTHEADVLFSGFGVHRGDPDGLYHLLGEKGAISSPMHAKSEISPLLEKGRSLFDRKEIDEHYQKVSRMILKEVPYVHFAFMRRAVAFRPDRIQLNVKVIDQGNFDLLDIVAE